MSRLERLDVRLLFPAALLTLLSVNVVPLGHYVDDLLWVMMSENILKGTVRFSWNMVPAAETTLNWGFSVLLLPVVAVLGRNALALKMWSAALFLGGLMFFHRAVRDDLSAGGRLLLATALFFNGYSLAFAGNVISENGYLFLFGLLVFVLHSRRRLWEASVGEMAAWGGVAAWLCLTRTMGVAFVLAVGLELFFSRRYKQGLAFAGAVAAGMLPVFLYGRWQGGEFTYYQSYWTLRGQAGVAGAVSGFIGNLGYYWKGLTCLALLNLPVVLAPALVTKLTAGALAGSAALAGLWHHRREGTGRFLGSYFLIYGAVCGIWSYRAPRYVFPLYPVFLFFVATGVDVLFRQRWRPWVYAALIALSVGTNAPAVMEGLRASLTQPTEIAHASYDWLAEHTSSADKILSMDLPRIHYYAGLSGASFLPCRTAEELAERSRRAGIFYFLSRGAGFVEAAPGVNDPILAQHDRFMNYLSRADLFDLLYENTAEDIRIYRLTHSHNPNDYKAQT